MTSDIALTTSRISCAFYTEAPNNCEIYVSNSLLYKKDKKLWAKITDSDFPTALDDLLPPERTMDTLRKRRHNYILPLVRTERFKRTFINRCLFSY